MRNNANHHASKRIVSVASTVYLEDLKVKHMSTGAKGTADKPGMHVRQKSGLNRSILATGWGKLESMLRYKCRQVTRIPAS